MHPRRMVDVLIFPDKDVSDATKKRMVEVLKFPNKDVSDATKKNERNNTAGVVGTTRSRRIVGGSTRYRQLRYEGV